MFKKIVSLLTLIFAVFSAFAQENGNLNNGGFVFSEKETVYLADGNALWMLKNNKDPVMIEEGPVSMLQAYDGRLYYLKDRYGEDTYGFTSLIDQTPMSCLMDGTDKKCIGASRAVGSHFDFAGETSPFMELDMFIGYQNFTVYDGYIYYLSNSGISGEYECTGKYGYGEETLSIP